MVRLPICSLCLLSAVAVSAVAQQGKPAFLTAAWRNAPKAGPAWSREGMVASLEAAVLGKKASRPEIIERLGQPGLSTEWFEFGADRAGRRETYRLSAANETSLQIAYDAQKRMDSYGVVPPGCTFRVPAHGGTVPKSVVNDKLMKRLRESRGERRSMTMAQASALIGVPADYWWVHARTGGRNWMNFGKTWRITGERRRFLTIAGSIAVAYSNEPPSPEELKLMDGGHVDGFQLTTFWPDCLPP